MGTCALAPKDGRLVETFGCGSSDIEPIRAEINMLTKRVDFDINHFKIGERIF
jgi:hypothetical protein